MEPATYNRNDSSYVPNDQQPIWHKRVLVTESKDKAAMTTDDDGNLSIQEESTRPLSYTQRLYGNAPSRGKLGEDVHRGRGGRGRGRGRGGRGRGAWRGQGADRDATEPETAYEAEITVPCPRGSEPARRHQRALNHLQIAHLILGIRPTQMIHTCPLI